MIPQQLIEAVLEESPLTDGTIALRYLNDAQREFAQKSGILRKTTTWSPPAKQLEHTITEIADLLHIREIWQVVTGNNKKINPTHLESYLPTDTGFWHVKGSNNGSVLIRIGWWDGNTAQPFDTSETFEFIYEAYPREIGKDSGGNDDLTAPLELNERWHDALVYRAVERGFVGVPEMRSYYFARYREDLLEAKREANKQGQNAEYNVKVYTH